MFSLGRRDTSVWTAGGQSTVRRDSVDSTEVSSLMSSFPLAYTVGTHECRFAAPFFSAGNQINLIDALAVCL